MQICDRYPICITSLKRSSASEASISPSEFISQFSSTSPSLPIMSSEYLRIRSASSAPTEPSPLASPSSGAPVGIGVGVCFRVRIKHRKTHGRRHYEQHGERRGEHPEQTLIHVFVPLPLPPKGILSYCFLRLNICIIAAVLRQSMIRELWLPEIIKRPRRNIVSSKRGGYASKLHSSIIGGSSQA